MNIRSIFLLSCCVVTSTLCMLPRRPSDAAKPFIHPEPTNSSCITTLAPQQPKSPVIERKQQKNNTESTTNFGHKCMQAACLYAIWPGGPIISAEEEKNTYLDLLKNSSCNLLGLGNDDLV